MSTDDFAARLRARLTDLADAEDGWADPLPEARRRAALAAEANDPGDPGDPGDSGADVVVPLEPRPPHRRSRWLPGLAVAATVVALLVAGGFGIRALVDTRSDTSAGSAGGQGYAASCNASASACPEGGPGNAGPRGESGQADSGGTVAPGEGPAAGGTDTAGCAVTTKAASTGPLAGVATIRPSGIASPKTTSGGSAGISYQVTFGASAGTAQFSAARAVRSSGGLLCAAPPGEMQSNAIQVVPVEPGPGVSGSVAFTAVDSRGEPLPGGTYEVVVVIRYAVTGSGPSQLVSPPISVVVS